MILVIILAVFSVIALMVIHEFGHFIIAKKCGVKVEEFGIGYPPRVYGKKIGQTIYSINAIPLGAFVRIHGEAGGVEDYQSFTGLAIYKRIAIVLGGVVSFWIAAAILFTVVFNIGVSVPISDDDVPGLKNAQIQITGVSSDSPAKLAGLRTGDVVRELGVKGGQLQSVDKIGDFQSFVEQYKGQEITLQIARGSSVIETSLTPRVSPPENQGALGVQLQRTSMVIEKYPWYETPYRGVVFCGELTYKATISLGQLLGNLFTGKGMGEGAEPAGPVGLTVFIAQAAGLGAGFFLYFIAAISVLLAIFNLLPIPALDGGKILFLIIEKIRAKAISPKIEQTITVVFFFILISLSLFVTVRFDIPRFYEFIKNSF